MYQRPAAPRITAAPTCTGCFVDDDLNRRAAELNRRRTASSSVHFFMDDRVSRLRTIEADGVDVTREAVGRRSTPIVTPTLARPSCSGVGQSSNSGTPCG